MSFVKDLVPLLADQCLSCHEAGKAKGAYRVDSYTAVLQTGDSEEVPFVSGKPELSPFFQRLITHDEDDRMPQKGDALPAAQVELFRRWISEGLKFDGPDEKALISGYRIADPKSTAPSKYARPIPVTALLWLPDGKTLITSGYREVLLWDLTSKTLLKRVPDMPERVLAMTLHSNGKTLAVVGGTPGKTGELVVLDLETGQITRRLPPVKDTLLAVAYSPDGSLLATAGADSLVRVFRNQDQKPAWTAEAHADWVNSLAFSPDGLHLLSSSRDRTSKVFKATDGTPEASHTKHESTVTASIFDLESKTVISASGTGELRRWEVSAESDGEGSPNDKLLREYRQEITKLAVAGKSVLVATTSGRAFQHMLDSKDAPKQLHDTGARIHVMSLSPDAKRVALGDQLGNVTVRSLEPPMEECRWVASPGF